MFGSSSVFGGPEGHCVVGLAGPAGVGKSTLAAWLACVYEGKRLRFADGIKSMLLTLPGVEREHVDGALKNKPLDVLGGHTARYAMQTLGTAWGRGCMGADFWVRILRAQAEECTGLVVVDDVRRENEARAILALGGKVFELQRAGVEYSMAHVSEMPPPDELVTPVRLYGWDAPAQIIGYIERDRKTACAVC